MAELIRKEDTLNEGRVKLNAAITDAEKAKVDAEKAVDTSGQAKQIAQAAENKADSVQAQFNQVVIEGDSSVEAAQARVDAKGESHPTLKARLDAENAEVTAQLAETIKKIPNLANADSTLKVLNPYGNYQNIHPKVLHFPSGWNGYKWWMGYTPYPNGDIKKENPCLAVSNNGIDWTVPAGFANEVLDDWSGVEGAYNNDTHLVYRSDLDRLEIWWRYADSNTDIVYLYRRNTTDGINWDVRETMFTGNRKGDDHLSPAIIYEENKYKMLSVNTESTRTLNYCESFDGKNWGVRKKIETDWGTLTPWHLDFIKEGNVCEMILQAWDSAKDETNNTSSLYYLKSNDLINWSKPIKIISPTGLPKSFDNQGIYRSSIVKVNDIYFVFYSGVSSNGERAMSLSYGDNILALIGYSIDIENMTTLRIKDKTSDKAVNLFQNFYTNNVLDIRQSSNVNRFGGLKVGNLLFADGTTDGVTPESGSVRYNKNSDIHERFYKNVNGGSWGPFAPRFLLYARKTVVQSLTNSEFVSIEFEEQNIKDSIIGFTDNKTFNLLSGGVYRISIGLSLTGTQDGADLEVQVREGSVNKQLMSRQKISTNDGNFFINSQVVTGGGDRLTLGIKYVGSGSPKITQYQTQNFLYIERV